jgi:hypothetical protein
MSEGEAVEGLGGDEMMDVGEMDEGSTVLEVPTDDDPNETIEIHLEVTPADVSILHIPFAHHLPTLSCSQPRVSATLSLRT